MTSVAFRIMGFDALVLAGGYLVTRLALSNDTLSGGATDGTYVVDSSTVLSAIFSGSFSFGNASATAFQIAPYINALVRSQLWVDAK